MSLAVTIEKEMIKLQILKPSRFNVRSYSSEGELILFNSFSGAIGVVDLENRTYVENILSKGEISYSELLETDIGKLLIDNRYFIDVSLDEFKEAEDFHSEYFNDDRTLQIIILPTEECNFRCKYCYESFKRAQMPREIVNRIINFLENKVPDLDSLIISWFGGEPTEALNVIYDISEHAQSLCQLHGVRYRSGMTTNGYNLTPEVFRRLISSDVRHYQITVDGPREHHDRQRILREGGGTFDQIMQNLISMSQTHDDFNVTIRVNFMPNSLNDMDTFIKGLFRLFGNDKRFSPFFHPVGRWGGPNDGELLVCDEEDALRERYHLFDFAKRIGFDVSLLREGLIPGGSVCYAAKPWSFVIGASGSLHKCTVALEDERNQVGYLREDGSLMIHDDKFVLWISQNEEVDTNCQRCFFRPTCQGAACPLERMRSGESPCPPVKRHIKRALTTLI